MPWHGLIHPSLLSNLPPRSVVKYQCGIEGSQLSASRTFITPPDYAEDTDTVSFAVLRWGTKAQRW